MAGAAIVGVHNTKGGVGKTVSTLILASLLGQKHRVLAIDLDPIASLTQGCGLSPENYIDRSTERAVYAEVPAQELIVPVKEFKFDIIPASRTLGQAQTSGFPRYSAHQYEDVVYGLRQALEPLRPKYNFILIDTQPTQSTLTMMPLVASDYLLIPCATDYYAVRALAASFRILRTYIAQKNPELRILGVLPTMYNRRTRLSERMLNTLQGLCTAWAIPMFEEPVPFSVRYAETGQGKQPITEMIKDDKILRPYVNVAQWLEHVVGVKEGVSVGD